MVGLGAVYVVKATDRPRPTPAGGQSKGGLYGVEGAHHLGYRVAESIAEFETKKNTTPESPSLTHFFLFEPSYSGLITLFARCLGTLSVRGAEEKNGVLRMQVKYPGRADP